MKHHLPLIEEALDQDDHLTRGMPLKHIRSLLPRARRFVFDDASSAYMGQFIRDNGDLILDNRQFAIPPFDVTYIEFNLDEVLKQVAPQKHDPADLTRDHKVGYLIAGKTVYECASAYDLKRPQLSPLIFDVDTPSDGKHLFRVKGDKEGWARIGLFLGSTVHQVHDDVQLNAILNSIRIRSTLSDNVSMNLCYEMAQGMNGLIRNVWAALLLLNQHKHVRMTHVPPRPLLFRGKRRIYAAHSVVTLDLLDRRAIRRSVLNGRRESPRRHEVRGHFMHRDLGKGCVHLWPVMPDEEGHWKCHFCGGLRYWRNAFERGDASKGYATKDYDVTA